MADKEIDLEYISQCALLDESSVLLALQQESSWLDQNWDQVDNLARKLLKDMKKHLGLGAEHIMQRYRLTDPEGSALMSLAEALLRVPDKYISTMLVQDKLADRDWNDEHASCSHWLIWVMSVGLSIATYFSGSEKKGNFFHKLSKKITTPLLVSSVGYAIKLLGRIFVAGSDIEKAVNKLQQYKAQGFEASYDLLGESARTRQQAKQYIAANKQAITVIANAAQKSEGFFNRPNLSVKMTALYPRVEWLQKEHVEKDLVPILKDLALHAGKHQVSLTFDAEEAKRLDIYLHVFTKLIEDQEVRTNATIGLVVQAYQKRALPTIDHVINLAKQYKTRIPIRLVKGAYWDSEIKRAQESGLEQYPVYTRKKITDLSYLTCAEKILDAQNYIIAQFATHNAVTAAAIMEYGKGKEYEFQKLYGMGDSLHQALVKRGARSRIYAPVGKYHDLLAYLMRRLLENGANSSFVNQINRKDMSLKEILSNPKDSLSLALANALGRNPRAIYPTRLVAKGYEPGIRAHADFLHKNITKWNDTKFEAYSIINGEAIKTDNKIDILMPAALGNKIGEAFSIEKVWLEKSLQIAKEGFGKWSATNVVERAKCLYKAADVMESQMSDFLYILMTEAGKTLHDAIAEVREAVDFCRYYADRAKELMSEPTTLPGVTGESNHLSYHGRGVFLCISPWNFPLAIFLGQIVAALVAGNSVIAKPSEQTSIIAIKTVELLHKVGVPVDALQLVLAKGSLVGKTLISNAAIAGVCFTGSTQTALTIQKTLTARNGAIAPLIAETGGQNVMIVDSSALLEQVVDDVVLSAFGSAGQRCSALRILCIQEEIYEPLMNLIKGAIDELKLGNPYDFAIDIGPVIDAKAKAVLEEHINNMTEKGALLYHHPLKEAMAKANGHYVVPHIFKIENLDDLAEEVFGPVLHVMTYKADHFHQIIEQVNSSRYGLTFGLHTRIEERIAQVSNAVHVGNIYVNRSMIGAVVGSQPFGGERESGTGFKAGGPNYLLRFVTERTVTINKTAIGGNVDLIAESE